MVCTERSMPHPNRPVCLGDEGGLFAPFVPRPSVTKPELRKQVDCGLVRRPVMNGDLYQDVVRSRLEVLHENVPVAVAIEDAGINQLILVVHEAASCVLLNQPRVWIFALR